METQAIISRQSLLRNWQDHRATTKRVIECFPEKELFEFSIGTMRTFGEIVKEMISLAVPGLESIINNKVEKYNHDIPLFTKAQLLERWDEDTTRINELFNKIPTERFKENFNMFSFYDYPIEDSIQYFIYNEIHHKGQGYVYLRALGIEPPSYV
ncbi:damage-inducible protein DinB [Sphingobacterium sp. UT-1RO-CII-1]|uniref:DinB family protein n=1 Tax=Sphingobacterium sp. UT-1RO-CII-1 TaxID=2995225 RepID=UPI00227C8660|nr:DinB family protein [Sphingobacterium sp. UT-1RO-CII-1]MCY4779164.1 damage-inducible protein DinB [Sphingobacterium sp. UT-1RO-CII-1]